MPPAAEPAFDPIPLLKALADAQVDFVVIGGVAAGAHGSAYGTLDLDVAYSRERDNLIRLAAILSQLGATLRGAPPGLPFQLDAKTLEQGANFTCETAHGNLDIVAFPAGAPPYERLRADAVPIDVDGRLVRIASIDHLIAVKEAAGRTKDKLLATELRTISDELRAPRE